MMQQVYKSHKKWLEITQTFGVNKDRAKDIVSEMYLRLYQKIKKGQDISYKGQPNYWYIYKMLRGIYIDYLRKYKKIQKLYLKIDKCGDVICINRDGKHLTKNITKLKATEIFNYDLYYKKYLKIINEEKINESNLYFHKQHFVVFDEIDRNNLSITKYSKIKNKSYYSVYNSYTKAKKILKDKLINSL